MRTQGYSIQSRGTRPRWTHHFGGDRAEGPGQRFPPGAGEQFLRAPAKGGWARRRSVDQPCVRQRPPRCPAPRAVYSRAHNSGKEKYGQAKPKQRGQLELRRDCQGRQSGCGIRERNRRARAYAGFLLLMRDHAWSVPDDRHTGYRVVHPFSARHSGFRRASPR